MICSSGIGFDPVVAETLLEFGFHGIWQGTAVIYDKGTRSHWLHLTGECISGRHKGKQLKPIPGRHVQWWEWKRDHPDTRVMAQLPGFEKRYFPRANARRGHDYFPPMFPPTIHSKDARLATLEGDRFKELILQSPEISFEIFRELTTRVRHSESRLRAQEDSVSRDPSGESS